MGRNKIHSFIVFSFQLHLKRTLKKLYQLKMENVFIVCQESSFCKINIMFNVFVLVKG